MLAAARQIYLGEVATIRPATLAEARTHLFACRPAVERMTSAARQRVGWVDAPLATRPIREMPELAVREWPCRQFHS